MTGWTGKAWRCLCLAVFFATNAQAEDLPSFILDRCTWDATHIVLVTEGETIDGVFDVIESWKGACKPKDRITIAELAAFAPKETREVHKGIFDSARKAEPPSHVTGARMVLFLRREKVDLGKGTETQWVSANCWPFYPKEMKYSVLWLERGQAFAFVQWMNPGPNDLTSLGFTDAELKTHVADLLEGQARIDKAMKLSNRHERAKAVYEVARRKPDFIQWQAVLSLGECGEQAAPFFRELLLDEERSYYVHHVAATFRKLGPERAGPVLTAILKDELPVWQDVAPKLKAGWKNVGDIDGAPSEKSLRIRYSRLTYVLEALSALRYSECREIVAKYRKVLESLPPPIPVEKLVDPKKRSYPLEICDRILASENKRDTLKERR